MRIRKRTWRTKFGETRTAYVVDLGLDPVTKRRRRKQFPTRPAARAWVEQRPVAAPPAAGTVRAAGAAWIERVKADGRARVTWKKYEQRLDDHVYPVAVEQQPGRPDSAIAFGDWDMGMIDAPACLRFKTALQLGGKSPHTVHKVMGVLRMMFNDAERAGTVRGNPARVIRARRGEREKRPIEIPTPPQVRKLLKIVNGGGTDTPTLGQVLVNLLPATGLRPEEARAMPVSLVQVDRRPYTLRVAWAANDQNVIGPPKSKAGYRTLPLSDDAAGLLRAWLKVKPKSHHAAVGPLVFPTSGGHVYGNANLYHRVWRPLMHAAGFIVPTGRVDPDTKEKLWKPAFTMYALRHFYASMLIDQGMKRGLGQGLVFADLTQKMGHASVQLTIDTYGHLWKNADRDQAIADGIGRFLAG